MLKIDDDEDDDDGDDVDDVYFTEGSVDCYREDFAIFLGNLEIPTIGNSQNSPTVQLKKGT